MNWLVFTASALLAWEAPTQNEDGSPLADLAGYRVYSGCTGSGQYDRVAQIDPGSTSYVVTELADGATCYFAVSAYNTAGAESQLSNEATKITPPLDLPGPVTALSIHHQESIVAVSVDDSVARFTGTPNGTNTITSASFTPANNSLLLVGMEADGNLGVTIAFTVTDSETLTWTEAVVRNQADAGATEGAAGWHYAEVTTGVSMTVSVARTVDSAATDRLSAKIYICTGYDTADPIGVIGEGSSTTNNISPSVTQEGGRLFGNGMDWNALGTPSSTDTEDAAHYAGEISVISAYKASDASGSQSINLDASGASAADWNYSLVEIRAAPAAGGRIMSSLVGPGGLAGQGGLAGSGGGLAQ